MGTKHSLFKMSKQMFLLLQSCPFHIIPILNLLFYSITILPFFYYSFLKGLQLVPLLISLHGPQQSPDMSVDIHFYTITEQHLSISDTKFPNHHLSEELFSFSFLFKKLHNVTICKDKQDFRQCMFQSFT